MQCDFLNLEIKPCELQANGIGGVSGNSQEVSQNQRESPHEKSTPVIKHLNSEHQDKQERPLASTGVHGALINYSGVEENSKMSPLDKESLLYNKETVGGVNVLGDKETKVKEDVSCDEAATDRVVCGRETLGREDLSSDKEITYTENILFSTETREKEENFHDRETVDEENPLFSKETTGVVESVTPRDHVSSLEGNSFDAVIFSLFLEYIPSPQQRFRCCRQAYDLLRPNGILCIITPDSKHQNANVHLYKLWKITLAFLGFSRIKYDKQSHFHGMVFRKGLCKRAWELDAEREIAAAKKTQVKDKFSSIDYEKVHSEIYIPQDFQDFSESEEELEND